ncbi:hypothetical protein [uncultured Leptotrichia sp.]|uniref:hypothetical protein n=1 Tax=uncultured Leptotrichia sp. TaxID=159271 RepID=UPI0025FC56FF|nr:hypothetical protein [uncultured Leptotrichia sp.]
MESYRYLFSTSKNVTIMKFKIRKYAGGGGFMASIYQPVTTSNKGSSRVALAAALLGG